VQTEERQKEKGAVEVEALLAWKEKQQRILADECKRAFAGRIKIFLMVVCPREARPHLKPASQMVGPLSKRFYGVEAVETETPHSEMFNQINLGSILPPIT
jgi:hypothetical protein